VRARPTVPMISIRERVRARTAAELCLEAAARRTSTREELLPTGARQESLEAITPEVDSAWVASSPLQAEAGTHQAQEEQRAQAERPEAPRPAERPEEGRVRAEPAPAVPAPGRREARPQEAAPRAVRAEAPVAAALA